MKQFIWMLCGIFLSGLLLGTLSACGADQFGVAVVTTGAGQAEDPPEDSALEEDAGSGGEAGFPDADPAPAEPDAEAANQDLGTARNLAYAKVLEDALLKGVLPDGENLDWTSAEDAEKNQFAVCDLDGDGEEELLLRWTNATMAGTMDVVFGYDDDTQTVYQKFGEFAGVQFYASGAAKADWSHNQGWAGRVWPFNLYQYDGGTGTYQEVGSVDAWDRTLFEDDEVLSAAFTAYADADGDGVVYYILAGEWYNNSRTPSDGNLDGKLWGTAPVDGADVDNWMNFYTGGTEPIQIPLQDLAIENISELGYWSIPGPAQQAAG